ncbi:TPA: hypothetical protein ON538_003442 [Morganella morganii]|nr:hypothetical protein [Morganella morganii]
MEKLKVYFRESIALLASAVVLTAGIYLFSDYYVSSRGGMMSYILYFFSTVSFLIMTVIAFGLVASDAMKTYAEMNSNRMKLLLLLVVFVNIFGFIGTLIISVKNVGNATEYIAPKCVPLPASLTQPVLIPLPPSD